MDLLDVCGLHSTIIALHSIGPCRTIDSACSSVLIAVEQAYEAMRRGDCDSALVAGCNLCIHARISIQFFRGGMINKDGRCKFCDENADGYCRGETISVFFLQKFKDCRRLYCTVVHVNSNCDGYKEKGILYPSGQAQQQLYEDFYEECQFAPEDVVYIQAHGTGTKVRTCKSWICSLIRNVLSLNTIIHTHRLEIHKNFKRCIMYFARKDGSR